MGAVRCRRWAGYGGGANRGPCIPGARGRLLLNRGRIPARVPLLKPLSAAISIGTGGPFGAEGPIIATGGALGSLLGQLLHTTAVERKTLLAAGAAAGMTTWGRRESGGCPGCPRPRRASPSGRWRAAICWAR